MSTAEGTWFGRLQSGASLMRRTIPFTLVALLFISPARATTIVATDLAELSREALAIALGRVVAVEPRWTLDRRRIETLVTLEAESYLKGSLGSHVRFVVPGGQLGRFRNLVVGAPHLELGHRIVAFLGATGPSVPYILGFNQGLYRVTLENGSWIVTPPTVTAVPGIARTDRTWRSMRFDEFARQVRALAGRRP